MRRRKLTKKKRVCCDFCGKFSSSHRYETRQNKQEHESLESQLKGLRLLTRRMTGKDLYGLSFPELVSLKSHLRNALLIVRNQKEKMPEFEKLLRNPPRILQKTEAAGKDKAGLLAPSTSSREKQDAEALPKKSYTQIGYERRKAESMESEVERLWLLKERMSGRELGNMNFFELCLLENHMLQGLGSFNPATSDLFYLLSV